ncbi:T9SS type A sorting domain-containing protein [Lishizhenia sp.]|uniref:T9SS type A sorting domain-containing protein n=1 Tax=Lishizhenia sp. TaxID=2497594 RepID=UPI00299DDC46|nr:T9SS type A sorting domain-containing protein [Lishizhenia sp.]MDX1446234.1 T9SS type A sorting domain-containing protein [Lishizhenia sp.]
MLNVYLNPVQVIPLQSNCNNGYDFQVAVDYVITATSGYTAGDILAMDAELYCYGATGAGAFVLPLDTASGQILTSSFNTLSTNCNSDTPNDLLCDGFYLHINAKQVSSQYIYCIPSVPLSTSLLSVDITHENQDLNLEWVTATESETRSYLVEHLYDEEDWQMMEEVQAQGYSEIQTYYQSTLTKARVGIHYFKLSEIDLNGDTTFLKLMSYEKSSANNIHPYPNPSADGGFSLPNTDLALNTFNIYDSTGKLIGNEKYILFQKGDEIKVQLKNTEKGLYFLKDDQGNSYRLIYM